MHDVTPAAPRTAPAGGMQVGRARAVYRVARRAYRYPHRRPRLVHDVACALLPGWKPSPTIRKLLLPPPSGKPVKPRLPRMGVPDGPVTLPDLRVAAILDTFSELAFRYEWNQVTFTPANWHVTLTEFRPQLLFVESCWAGNRGSWRGQMSRGAPGSALQEIVAWCRAQGVPTVFWNKEDPPNYDIFLPVARLFDHVFTVDADRIPDYRRDLGHDRIGLLPFGAQPRIHNPVQAAGSNRANDVAFAGTYFAEKHDARRAQMEHLLLPALEHGLHIYSRMQGGEERYRFPAPYAHHVVGSLPYEEMLSAYTAYKVFLNVNSVTASPTMCARRLFELSAAQTAVVSAPAAAIAPYFGADVEVAPDAEATRRALTALIRHEELRSRRGLRAHRRVFDAHLYSHRVDTVLAAVGLPLPDRRRTVSAVVPTNRPGQLDHVLRTVGSQNRPDVELVLVHHGFDVAAADVRARAKDLGVADLVLVPADAALTLGACMDLGVAAASGEVVSKMDDDNHYGPNYLRDLVRAFDYTDAAVVGKWAHYTHLQGSNAVLLRFPDAEHRYVDLVQGGTLTVRRELARQVGFGDLPRAVDTTFLTKVREQGATVYSTDRFNFVSVRQADGVGHTWPIGDGDLLAKRGRLVFYGDPREHAEV